MGIVAFDGEALAESLVFLSYFNDLPDHRQRGKVMYALKANQGTLRADVDLFVAEQKANNFRDTTITRHQTVDAEHGRIETRDTTVIHDLDWLQALHNWPAPTSVVMVESTRVIPGLTHNDRHRAGDAGTCRGAA